MRSGDGGRPGRWQTLCGKPQRGNPHPHAASSGAGRTSARQAPEQQAPEPQAAGPAELIFSGGPVYTVPAGGSRMVPAATRPDGPPATAVAVRGGRIIAVSTDDAVRELAGPGTSVVDLRGRPVLPGFQDAHVHPTFAGLTMLRCDLADAADAAGALHRVRAYADTHPDHEWISGSGWRMEWFAGGTPGRELLDQVLPDRPAYLTNRDGHGAWVNSRALALAGLDASTPDPADGRIERATDGSPQGTLHEGAALLVGPAGPGGRPRRSGWPACCWPSSTCTRSASPPGRTRSSASTSATPTRCRSTWPPRGRDAHRPGGGRPVVGPRPRR